MCAEFVFSHFFCVPQSSERGATTTALSLRGIVAGRIAEKTMRAHLGEPTTSQHGEMLAFVNFRTPDRRLHQSRSAEKMASFSRDNCGGTTQERDSRPGQKLYVGIRLAPQRCES